MSIDLHVHSTYSDGTMSPKELVEYAERKGLQAISITDHDTIDGVDEAIAASKNDTFKVIPGIEIGAKYSDITIHLLGYFIDQNDQEFRKALEVVQDARNARNDEILFLLEKLGIHISKAELRTISQVGQTGRPHIAKILLKKKVVKTLDEAFKRFLRLGAPAYVPRFLYTAEEVFNMIHLAGGIGVLAHPLQLRSRGINLNNAIKELVTLGLDGIEIYYPTHSKKTRTTLLRYADECSLVKTGGSDYHGENRPGTTLAGGKNVTVPYELLEKMEQRLLKINRYRP